MFRKNRNLSTTIITSLLLIGVLLGSTLVETKASANLAITALNDVPGPVMIEIQGWDVHNDLVFQITMMWTANDNLFSTEEDYMPKTVRVLRLTFVNDYFVYPYGPDDDRNAFIDYFKVNNLLYQAEDFDRTGGPDQLFPGCTQTFFGTTSIADCGNQGDYVEYDLHPGNPVGPDPDGPGERNGPK